MVRGLLERFDGFVYGYRMRCDCGGAVDLSAETYYREQFNEALVPCPHCGGQVHFGPAVALLRDEDDPALDDSAVPTLAWYHTSRWKDWPSDGFAAEVEEGARRTAEHYGFDPAGMVERATTKALHFGTYEAAIENMLRRMRNEGDADEQFYLFRVRLTVEPGRINEGYRDENAEEASQVTLADLDAADVDALRYLNVHEATGTLSLAVRPTCITSLQRLAIPVARLATAPDAELSAQLVRLDDRQSELDAAAASMPNLSIFERAMMRAGKLPEPPGLLDRLSEIEDQERAIRDERVARLTSHYLPDISPVVADALVTALGSGWGSDDANGRSFAERFGEMAALLTRSPEVIREFARQPWRAVSNT